MSLTKWDCAAMLHALNQQGTGHQRTDRLANVIFQDFAAVGVHVTKGDTIGAAWCHNSLKNVCHQHHVPHVSCGHNTCGQVHAKRNEQGHDKGALQRSHPIC
eukprot:3675657-Amphidinium_carterae.1